MARPGSVSLSVWLHETHVATLSEPSTYRYRLTFTDEALDTFGVGARVLSLSLPLSSRPLEDHPRDPTRQPVSSFLEGLLPEGNLRTHLATTLGVLALDKLSLLTQVGAECAGAVRFLPVGQRPSSGHVRPLGPDEVDRLVADLPTYRLPDGAAPQASLAGIQDKVLLTELPDGSWGWPEAGAASSHLVKPEPTGAQVIDRLVQTEHWAMQVAASAGLRAAHTRLAHFDGRPAIVVRRYDRLDDGQRVHQEDFCQALALDPQAKYESPARGPSRGTRLKRLATVAAPRSLDPDAFRRDLLSSVAFNVVIGNGDAHSKNYSLLLGRRGEVSLAPLYDAAPVHYLATRFNNIGHVVNGRTRLHWVDADDLVQEARSWGMGTSRARATLEGVLGSTWEAAHAVGLPEGAESVLVNLEQLWSRRSWRPAST
ncbi:serine/threonine-protein kinase HipA [Nocardioides salarius]|uniref:Serine/threonine-protein kinase HipA n=1 Tax=Nocardioides salarius TaxID=374513 RepID=A0ABS2M916_9ACTN|nr:HipA domain-containing protein [Nocardioides salarius]MBM7507687.1 serine/threonine-protein kinase HipA [Nocardioides salarius]